MIESTTAMDSTRHGNNLNFEARRSFYSTLRLARYKLDSTIVSQHGKAALSKNNAAEYDAERLKALGYKQGK